LSHPSELVTHPALCRTFRSNKIRVLAEQALDSIRAEHAHMTKLSRLLSVLLGDENILSEPEEIVQPQQTMEDSESDKDIDIMDLDEPAAKEREITNGESNGHSSMDADDAANGVEINGTDPTIIIDQPQNEETIQLMETDEPSESTLAQASNSIPAETQPTNGTAPASVTVTPSRSPTPLASTRPTTRLQTAASTRPHTVDTDFSWPSSLVLSTPATSATDLGLTKTEASEVRRMVQAALERSQEFLRCLEKVRLALVRADKQRKMVWLWCKDSAKLVAEQELEEQ
jgi:RXT2-like, N-terminal